MSTVREMLFGLLVTLPLAAGASAPAPLTAPVPATGPSDCRGESFAVAPLEPLALSPHDALDEEGRVRDVLSELENSCLVARAHSAKVLAELPGLRVPSCPDAACRAKLVERFGARWLVSGTVYGLGGGRTVTLTLWSADGAIVQRASYTGSDPQRPLTRLVQEARLGHSLVAEAGGKGDARFRLGWPQVALGGAAVTALAVGGGFGYASLRTERRLSTSATGCQGDAIVYQQCFADEYRLGARQARTANVLYGLAAVLGASAAVSFAVEWP